MIQLFHTLIKMVSTVKCHDLIADARSQKKLTQFSPALCLKPGLLFQLSFGAGDRGLSRFKGAGGYFPEIALCCIAELSKQDDPIALSIRNDSHGSRMKDELARNNFVWGHFEDKPIFDQLDDVAVIDLLGVDDAVRRSFQTMLVASRYHKQNPHHRTDFVRSDHWLDR